MPPFTPHDVFIATLAFHRLGHSIAPARTIPPCIIDEGSSSSSQFLLGV